MAFQLSPGINISEIDLTTVVPAVGTTEGAFVGSFRWGPVNERVLVSSEVELVQRFGKPHTESANNTVSYTNHESFFTAANFLSYSDALYVTRVVDSTAVTADGTNFKAKYPGALGNSIDVSYVDADGFAPVSGVNGVTAELTPSASTGSLKFVTTANTGATAVENSVAAGDILIADGQEFLINAVGSTTVVEAQIDDDDDPATPTITQYTYTIPLTFATKYIGVAAFSGNYTIQPGAASQFDSAPGTGNIHVVVTDRGGLITGTAGTILEKWGDVSMTSGAKKYDGSSNHLPTVLENSSNYILVNDNVNSITGNGVESMTGGDDGVTEDSTDLIGEIALGWDLYKNAEDVDVSLLLTGNSNSTVANYVADNIAEYRKDCVAFVSPALSDATAQDIVDFAANVSGSSYVVMDTGYKYQYDKYNDVYRWIPLNGDVAGTCARTDDERDPWFSPAGYNRGQLKNVIKLKLNPNKTERDLLYKNNINPVIIEPGQGAILFGDKTMQRTPSAFDRINVRRLFIVLEKAIAIASRSTLFEFNDEFTRAQFVNLIEPFLRDVQGRRGIYDFKVVCDTSNNTGEVIDRNEFIGDIYIKPARSINFIQLNFIAVRTGVEFNEIIGQN